jgi:hypothetical protein
MSTQNLQQRQSCQPTIPRGTLGDPGTLSVPAAFTGDTIVPEIATPSSLAKEKSPSWTAGGGEKVKAADPPHETLTSVAFQIVIRMSVS